MSEQSETTVVDQPSGLAAIAQQQFGDKFHGEVPETTTVEVVEPELVEEVEELEQSAETEELDPVEETDALELEEQGEEISTLSELSEFMQKEQGLDVTDEFFEKLQISGKVNGEDVNYSISDLRAVAQKFDAADSYLANSKEKAKASIEDHTAKSEYLNRQYGVVSGMIDQLESALMADQKDVDWVRLKEEDAGAYAAARQDYNDRLQGINGIKQQAGQEYENWKTEQEGNTTRDMAATMEEESVKLYDKIPEWSDPDVGTKERTAVAGYLQAEGYTLNELQTSTDHRLIVMARKAMLYDAKPTTAEAAKKLVKRIPKILKPGGQKTVSQQRNQSVDNAMKKAQNTGTLGDAHALLKAKRANQSR